MGLGLDLTGVPVGALTREISGHMNDTYQQETTVQDLDETIGIVRVETAEHEYVILVTKKAKTPAEQEG